MKKVIIFFIVMLMIDFVYAQSPTAKQWDHRYGGTGAELITCFFETADGGFILGGHSTSPVSGDKTQPSNGGFDYWIVKLDSNGLMQWDKDFGGFDDDLLYSLAQTADGGYLLGGTSYSGMSGDKTDTSRGSQDYWIVKTDPAGNKEWDKTFGGNNIDWAYSVVQVADGGYMVGGYSYSDSSGEKTRPSLGSKDYWIIKTDSLGNLLWDKSYGGADDDWFYAMQPTTDNGFILGGFSNSGISGDKTQPTWGGYDCWIIKIDSTGNKLWDKDFGGTSIDGLFSLIQTSDGGFVFGGPSLSGIGGNKTQPTWGAYDYWIIKTDSAGNYEWDKDFGGTANEEVFGNIFQTADNGYLVAGLSYSGIGGDKTENNLGAEQTWVVKTDSIGNKQWDKTLFTTGHDEAGLSLQSKDGCIVFANFTSANVGGYKSQPSWNNVDDYWIVKFCDSVPSSIPTVDTHFQISAVPNPFSDEFTIKIQKSAAYTGKNNMTIEIKNMLGMTNYVYRENNYSNSYIGKINLSELHSGIYFLIVTLDGKQVVNKIVKQ